MIRNIPKLFIQTIALVIGVMLLFTAEVEAGSARQANKYYKKGMRYQRQKKYDQAIEEYRKALEENSQSIYHKKLAECLAANQQLEEALDEYKYYLDSSPSMEEQLQVEESINEILAKIQLSMGTVEVVSTPDNADLFIDKKEPGNQQKTPYTIQLNQGKHTFFVSAQGFADEVRTVFVEPGKKMTLNVQLKANPARLKLDAPVQGAQVFIDGELAGTTPLVKEGLTMGPHKVKVVDGEEVWRGTVRLDAGKEKALQVVLKEDALGAHTDYWTAAWITLGSGVALTGMGIAFHAMAAGDISDGDALEPLDFPTYDDYKAKATEFEDSASTKTTVAYIGYGVGGAAIVTSIVFFVIDADRETSEDESYPDVAYSVLPLITSDQSAGLALHVRF